MVLETLSVQSVVQIHVQPALVESSHRLKSIWEANNVIKVVYSEMGRLKCDRVDRLYGSRAIIA